MEKKYSVRELYNITKKKNETEHNKYVKLWYNNILYSANRGFFETNLHVDSDHRHYNSFCPFVLSAIKTIKELFPGILLKEVSPQEQDMSEPFFQVSWNLPTENDNNVYFKFVPV